MKSMWWSADQPADRLAAPYADAFCLAVATLGALRGKQRAKFKLSEPPDVRTCLPPDPALNVPTPFMPPSLICIGHAAHDTIYRVCAIP
jgi:hypothetical protein